MKYRNSLFIIAALAIFLACNSTTKKIDENTYLEYQKKGDEITNLTQATLLSNVGSAIQKGGTEYAVEFCNLKAVSIVDSLNTINNVAISRITNKNRNPENKLKDDTDETIFNVMNSEGINDTLLLSESTLIYYKPIRTGLAACLRCHGDPQTDINASTLAKINQLYPNDNATGYSLNDFRGLWKVEFINP